jgi:hypothetical protein
LLLTPGVNEIVKVGVSVTPGRSLPIKADVHPTQSAGIRQFKQMLGRDGEQFGGLRRG